MEFFVVEYLAQMNTGVTKATSVFIDNKFFTNLNKYLKYERRVFRFFIAYVQENDGLQTICHIGRFG